MKIKTIITIMALTAASIPTFGQGLKSGIPLDNLDRTARPGDDFYQFACGGWVKNNPLPSAYSRFGSFDQVLCPWEEAEGPGPKTYWESAAVRPKRLLSSLHSKIGIITPPPLIGR